MKRVFDDLRVGDVVQHETSAGHLFDAVLLVERSGSRFTWLSLYDGSLTFHDYAWGELGIPLNLKCKDIAYGQILLLAEAA